jgi:HD-GYP domain-containing protein (c-di-GMP phosphodiesterase class II)
MVAAIGALRSAIGCILHHHERWDGGGYPNKLAGSEIPLEARILALADAYDAMTMTRPYRPALSHDDAVREVERCAGSQFDPELAAAFLQIAS